MALSSAPRAGDRQKQMNSAPLLQILFRIQTPVVTFLRAAWTLPLRGLTGAKALILGSQTLQGRGLKVHVPTPVAYGADWRR